MVRNLSTLASSKNTRVRRSIAIGPRAPQVARSPSAARRGAAAEWPLSCIARSQCLENPTAVAWTRWGTALVVSGALCALGCGGANGVADDHFALDAGESETSEMPDGQAEMSEDIADAASGPAVVRPRSGTT